MKNSRENKNFIFSLVSSFFYSKQTKGEKDEDNKANISLDGKETDSVNALPILEKGVSVQAGDKIKDYLIFEVMDREEDSFKIHCESYQEYCGKEKTLPAGTPLWAYTADISVSFGEEISISAESFDNAFVSVYRKQKLYICGEKPRCLRRG